MIETLHWHTLHPRYLDSSSNVLDLGANIGQFSRAIVERFGCKCVAVEPAPNVFKIIPNDPHITKIRAAVATKNGRIPLHLTMKSDGNSILEKKPNTVETIEVEAITLPYLLDRLGWMRVDLVKMDIEGAEIALLEQCPDEYLSRIAQITIEFHDFNGLTPHSDVRRVLARLRGLGFYWVRMSGYGHQDTWLINTNLLPISKTELLLSKYILRNWRGGVRVAKRWLAH